ncbi:type II secretion system F family protein [Methanobrevibacter sp.]|uniref:type II secretion system F family protein n=1 Tax=Methanobrevibacter sp. TaxID=66852 RepID=UPI003890E522
MFDGLFISVGNFFLFIFNSIKNFKFPSFKSSKKPEEMSFDFKISDNVQKDDFAFDDIRNFFIQNISSKMGIAALAAISLVLFIGFGFEISAIFLTVIVMLYIFMVIYPQIKQKRDYDDLNLELPYALRHMGIELKSGKGLHDTLMTVANANYGSFSRELTRVLEEVRYGQSTENALLDMSDRVGSDGLSRCVQQIVGTLRVGGNLANSLEVIATDISFDMHVKLKDYSQRLNAFILIYTFIAILAPVILLIMLMAASTVMGDIIPSNIIMIMYVGLFPMIVVFMGVLIKKLEPKI